MLRFVFISAALNGWFLLVYGGANWVAWAGTRSAFQSPSGLGVENPFSAGIGRRLHVDVWAVSASPFRVR